MKKLDEKMLNERIKIFKNYADELSSIAGELLFTPQEAEKTVVDYSLRDWYEWHDICDNGKEVGFIIIATAPQCHSMADFYIANAYVKPEYRKKGLAEKCLKNILDQHPGRYCYNVIKKNKKADEIWKKIFGRAGYEYIDLPLERTFSWDKETQYAVQPCPEAEI